MKLTTFVLGGLAGAAAVMLLQRNARMAAMAGNMGWSQIKSRMNGMKEEAVGKMLNMRIPGANGDAFGFGGKDRSRRDEEPRESAGGLDKVAHLAAQDSEVQRRVNEILEESGQHRI